MTSAKEYIQSVFETVKARNGHEAEFLQAVEEFFSTLEPVFEKHPEYIEENILARITEWTSFPPNCKSRDLEIPRV